MPPPPYDDHAQDDYSPFQSRAEFELAELLFAEKEMSTGKIDKLLNVLLALYDTQPPFTSSQELNALIDSIKQGDVPWNSFSVTYDGARPPDNMPQPPWMDDKYEVWFRDPVTFIPRAPQKPSQNDDAARAHDLKRRARDIARDSHGMENEIRAMVSSYMAPDEDDEDPELMIGRLVC